MALVPAHDHSPPLRGAFLAKGSAGAAKLLSDFLTRLRSGEPPFQTALHPSFGGSNAIPPPLPNGAEVRVKLCPEAPPSTPPQTWISDHCVCSSWAICRRHLSSSNSAAPRAMMSAADWPTCSSSWGVCCEMATTYVHMGRGGRLLGRGSAQPRGGHRCQCGGGGAWGVVIKD